MPVTIGKLQLRVEAPAKSGKQLADIVVRSQPGPEVRLRDLGTLKDAAAPQTSQLRVNSTAMVAIPIYAQPGCNASTVYEAVRKALPAMQAKLRAAEGKLEFLALGGHKQADLLTVHVRAVSGLRFDLVEERVVQVERFLQALIPATERIGTVTELGLRHDLSAAFTQNTAEQDATIHVQLTGKGPLSAQAYAARLRRLLKEEKRFADLQFMIMAGAEVPIDIQITGQRVANEKVIEEIRKRVARVDGAVDVQLIQRVDGPDLAINVDSEKAKQLGFDNPNVALQAAASLGCIVPQNNSISVMVTFGPAKAKTLDDVYEVPLRSGKNYLMLKELATLEQHPVEVQIDRVNRMRVYTVRALAERRPARSVTQDIEKVLQGLTLPAKVKVQVKLR